MGSKYFLLRVCCMLLVLSQHTLFPVVFARDVPVSTATSSPMPTSFGHVPTNNGAGIHVDVGHPGVTEQKPPRFPIPRCPFPPFCARAATTTTPANP
uniref:Uncharacterized protein n=1 Tax=Arundo donax TaxID=35708 RepID=A0A0A9AB20_ARUDO